MLIHLTRAEITTLIHLLDYARRTPLLLSPRIVFELRQRLVVLLRNDKLAGEHLKLPADYAPFLDGDRRGRDIRDAGPVAPAMPAGPQEIAAAAEGPINPDAAIFWRRQQAAENRPRTLSQRTFCDGETVRHIDGREGVVRFGGLPLPDGPKDRLEYLWIDFHDKRECVALGYLEKIPQNIAPQGAGTPIATGTADGPTKGHAPAKRSD